MKRVFTILMFMAALSSQAQFSSTKMVLIYTRNGEGYVHDNIEASVNALEEICASLNIETYSTDDPAIFEARKFRKFDAIIFSNSNNETFLNESQRENFQSFLRSGKGFMGIHSANASERDWQWYGDMVGGTFVRHPQLQPFDIRVIDSTHIATSHLPSTWHWEDECYYSDHLNPNIHVLLAADLTTVEDDQKAQYPGTVFGDYFPLAWCHEFEGARVFYTAIGHKIGYYQDENFRKHLEGGVRWVLGE